MTAATEVRRPLLSDLEQVDPVSSHTRGSASQEPGGNQRKNTAWTQAALAVAAPAPGGNRIALVGRGIAAGTDTTVLCHR